MGIKIKNKSLILQEGMIRSKFRDSTLIRNKDESLIWIHKIRPTPLSRIYTVKLKYSMSKGINVYVIDPKPLPLAKGETMLPHVYSNTEQKLCLYYPNKNEWNRSMFLIETIIPWISEWLFYYEIWEGTGIWKGGGIHADAVIEKNLNNEKNN